MDVFWTSIQSVLSIVIMIAIGYICQNKGWFDDGFSGALSKLIMNVGLPASIFMAMLERFKPAQLQTLSVGLLYSILAVIVGYLIAWGETRLFKVPKGRRGLMMTAINGANTVFIGMPLNIALFGKNSVPYLLVYYIVNTVVIWTFGVWVIAADDPTASGQKAQFDWHHLIPTPLWGFIVALPFIFFWPHAATQLPTFITSTLSSVGALVTPLSLIYIGIMLSTFGLKNMKFDRHVVLTLLGRFVISPIIMGLIIFIGLHAGMHMVPVFSKTLIIQAATPALAVLPILANTYHSDVKFATNIVVSTSTLFIIVVPIIMGIINFI
ncbi:AEC family transporter [Lactobacillus sp. DCY120]|uniref:AEC family transporter n=1 Tax=Bombilactobacillus apium TaxID=2675299 RepID=A0A850QZ68_9LACO|nr:AEC family transporter [Bombilactobacillus apium]NVY97134.1 AEC family transporter [Bombilactobacillus apium]